MGEIRRTGSEDEVLGYDPRIFDDADTDDDLGRLTDDALDARAAGAAPLRRRDAAVGLEQPAAVLTDADCPF